mmetsp:Transcript_2630/g.7255  ORF Transcript_2630/g.7255 Transcript_2630/m.7255 type:complete len:201 (+) Transcript_2630:124-726(+)
MTEQLFTLSQRFSEAVEIINTVDPKKLVRILQRIIHKLYHQKGDTFSAEEQERLAEVLGLHEEQLATLMEICSFIFEQASYVQLSLQQLKEQLEKAGMQKDQNIAFLKVWDTEGSHLIEALKEKSVVPDALDSVKWRLHLQTGTASLARLRTPTAIFELGMKNSATGELSEPIIAEFSHEELSILYDKLELIQEQVDMLS